MKVGLLSSWPPEVCGIRSHCENIEKHAASGVEYVRVGRPFSTEQVLRDSAGCEILHISYERNLHANVTPHSIASWRDAGKKVVLQDHNANAQICAINFPGLCDAYVVQDPHYCNKGIYYVPQGVMHVPLALKIERWVGTAGFPSVGKGGILAAQIARHFGLGFRAFAPISRHADSGSWCRRVQEIIPDAQITTTFEPQEEIVKELSRCFFTAWLYTEVQDASGISGSVRLGIGAMRPMLVSRPRMYRDLFDYPNDFYFGSDGYPTFEKLLPVAERLMKDLEHADSCDCGQAIARRPYSAWKDMDWTLCGLIYRALYEKLLGLPHDEALLGKYAR